MYRSFFTDVSICFDGSIDLYYPTYRSPFVLVSIFFSRVSICGSRKYRSILSDLSISLSLPIGLAQPLARGLIFRQNCDRGRPRRRLYSRTSTSSQQLEGPLSRESEIDPSSKTDRYFPQRRSILFSYRSIHFRREREFFGDTWGTWGCRTYNGDTSGGGPNLSGAYPH